MKRILLIATIYRVGERIYPIITELSREFQIDVFKTSQMSNKIDWYGNEDLRLVFDNKYGDYIDNIYYEKPDLSNYDLILMDDDRPRSGMKEIYDEVDVPVIGHQHGNCELYHSLPNLRQDGRTSWDYITVFGKKEMDLYNGSLGKDHLKNRILLGGIPSNDLLKNYKKTEEHILVIVNFLGNRRAAQSAFNGGDFRRFDEDTFYKMGLVELQDEFNKQIVIKIKSRADHPEVKKDFDYLDSILPKRLDYKIIMDIEDDNKLISDSMFVISAPSVMALKPIQKGIPTVLLKYYGQTAGFFDYKGLLSLDTQKLFDEIERQHSSDKETEFINYTIEGGLEFNSTEKYINEIRKLI